MPAVVKLMELICTSEKSLHELTEGFVIYPQVLENVRVTDKNASMQDEAVLAEVRACEEMLGDSGRMLVRASGTEPVVRVMAEAPSREICRECVDRVIAVMRERGFLQ
jgi:phosphoglucosamine mutase